MSDSDWQDENGRPIPGRPMPDFDDAGNETAVGYLNRVGLQDYAESVELTTVFEERHEFHLLLNQTAYCICGWAVTRPKPIGHLTKQKARAVAATSDDVAWFSERYREHLEDAANAN